MTATPPPIPIPSSSSSHIATHLPPLPLPMPASSSRSPPAFLTSRERERDRAHPYNRRQSISAAQNGQSPALPPRIYLEERERGDYSSMRSTAGPLSPLDRDSSSSTSVSASYLQSPHSSYNGGGGGESQYRRDDYDSPGPATHDLTRSRSRSQSYARTGTESADRVAFSLPPLHTLAHFGERLGGGMPTPPLGEMLPPGSGSPRVGPIGNGSSSSGGGLGLAGLRPSYAYDSPVMTSAQPKRYDAQTPRPPSPNYTSPSYPYPPISRQPSYVSASASSSLPTPARSRSHSSASAPGTATMRMAGLALNKQQQQQQQQQNYERYESALTPLNPVTAPSPGGAVPQNRRMAHLQSEQKRRE